MRMSENLNLNTEKREVGDLQKNQERWKVINNQEITPETLAILGGEDGINLIKSGWEKQKTGKGFNKTGEELAALGGAANLRKLEKVADYAEEMQKAVDERWQGREPESSEVSARNQAVIEIINGAEWNDLSDEGKGLLGSEENVGLIRSGWKKQNEGAGAMKTAEELMALTGSRGAAGVEDLMRDVELNDKLMELDQKYGLSEEEKMILNPSVKTEEIEELELPDLEDDDNGGEVNEPQLVEFKEKEPSTQPTVEPVKAETLEAVRITEVPPEDDQGEVPTFEQKEPSKEDVFEEYDKLNNSNGNLSEEDQKRFNALWEVVKNDLDTFRSWKKEKMKVEEQKPVVEVAAVGKAIEDDTGEVPSFKESNNEEMINAFNDFRRLSAIKPKNLNEEQRNRLRFVTDTVRNNQSEYRIWFKKQEQNNSQ